MMQVSYHKKYSAALGREMEFKRYGHAGRPVVMFPTSNGRFFQYEDTGTIAALGGFIESGRIQIWTLDGIDGETFFARHGDTHRAVGRHEGYFRHIREEMLPEIGGLAAAANGGREMLPLLSGCSMGAFHASNFVFRFPELVAGVIALSGVYSTRDFFGPALDGGIYYNSPLHYLAGLDDERILGRLRALRLIFCCGQGAFEESMLAETRQLETILRDRQVPAWFDYWGHDAAHDWPWWHKQLVYFLDHWLAEDQQRKAG